MTDEAYDQISLNNDSDILSMRGDISEWIQPPPDLIDEFVISTDHTLPETSFEHQRKLDSIERNNLYNDLSFTTIRSTALVESRIVGSQITENNVRTLLRLAGGLEQDPKLSEKGARQLLTFLAKRPHLLLITKESLDHLESTWTGAKPHDDTTSQPIGKTKFYVLLELATFCSPSWDLVRELTYLAVSETAFSILIEQANFKRRVRSIQSIPNRCRPCNDGVLRDAIKCFHSGSSSQICAAALSCSLLAIVPLPKRPIDNSLANILGLESIPRSRLRDMTVKVHGLANRDKKPKRNPNSPSLTFDQRHDLIEAQRLLYPKAEDLTFIRLSKRVYDVSKKSSHDDVSCNRCRVLNQAIVGAHHPPPVPKDGVMSAYGVVLAVSMKIRHSDELSGIDICLYAEDLSPGMENRLALSVIIEDLLRGGQLYHTLRHPLPLRFERRITKMSDMLWNLPLSCLEATKDQRILIERWIETLGAISARPIMYTIRLFGDIRPYWASFQDSLLHLPNFPANEDNSGTEDFRPMGCVNQ